MRVPVLNRRWWIVGLAIGAICLLLVLYYSWCWGWWGSRSRLLQNLFNCTCPAVSEEARYPDQVDILISACQAPTITVSPGGRFLRVGSYHDDGGWYYLDLQSMTRFKLPQLGLNSFLGDDFLLVDPKTGDDYLFNLQTAAIEQLTWLVPERIPEGVNSNGAVDPAGLLKILRSATVVYVLGDRAVAIQAQLVPGAEKRNYIFAAIAWLPGARVSEEVLPHFLETAGVEYLPSPRLSSPELVAASGRFIARRDGIYAVATGQRLIENYMAPGYGYLRPLRWIYDERGVILQPGISYLINIDNFPIFQIGPVYQPVLLLKLPPAEVP